MQDCSLRRARLEAAGARTICEADCSVSLACLLVSCCWNSTGGPVIYTMQEVLQLHGASRLDPPLLSLARGHLFRGGLLRGGKLQSSESGRPVPQRNAGGFQGSTCCHKTHTILDLYVGKGCRERRGRLGNQGSRSHKSPQGSFCTWDAAAGIVVPTKRAGRAVGLSNKKLPNMAAAPNLQVAGQAYANQRRKGPADFTEYAARDP